MNIGYLVWWDADQDYPVLKDSNPEFAWKIVKIVYAEVIE